MGIIGSFQGYVDSPLYLYNKGVWSGGQSDGTFLGPNISSNNRIMPNYIQMWGWRANVMFRLNRVVDLTGYKYIKMLVARLNQENAGTYMQPCIFVRSGSTIDSTEVASVVYSSASTIGDSVIVIDISAINGSYWLFFNSGGDRLNNSFINVKTMIKQIYLTNN